MTDCMESLLSSMSSKFNTDLDGATAAASAATTAAGGGGVGGGGGSALLNLDLAEDKTLKWRNLANNQFACKDKERKQKKLGLEEVKNSITKSTRTIATAAATTTTSTTIVADDGVVEQNIKELLAEEEEEEEEEAAERKKVEKEEARTTTKAEDVNDDVAAAAAAVRPLATATLTTTTKTKETPEVRTTARNDQGQRVDEANDDDDFADGKHATTTITKAITAAAEKATTLSAASLSSLPQQKQQQPTNDALLIVVKLEDVLAEQNSLLANDNNLAAVSAAAATTTTTINTTAKTSGVTVAAAVASVDDDMLSAAATDKNNETRSTSVSPLRRLRRTRRPSEAAADVESGKTNNATNTSVAVATAETEKPSTPAPTPPKRGRGRARKIPIIAASDAEPVSVGGDVLAVNVSSSSDAAAAATMPTTTEKRVGRKRKQPEEDTELSSAGHVKTEETTAAAVVEALLDVSADGKRTRRSVRLGNRMDGFKILEGPALEEIKIEPASTVAPNPNLALDPLSLTDAISHNDLRALHTPPMPTALDEKTPPKKRGRKAKVQQPPAAPTQQQTIVVSSEGSDQTTPHANAAAHKRNHAGAADLVIPKRSQRRIKPTTKILENDELRYEYETKHIVRITAAQSWEAESGGGAGGDMARCETTPTHQVVLTTATASPSNEKSSNFAASKQKSERSEQSVDSHHPQHYHHAPSSAAASVKKKLFTKFRRDIEASSAAVEAQQARRRKCPDLAQFLSDIRATKLNHNKSPEEHKLSKKQQRRLAKQKEKHFEKLGLRRRNAAETASSDATDSSSNDSDEFVPKQRVSVGKPSVTLRLRTAATKEVVAAVASVASPPKLQRKITPRQKLTPPPTVPEQICVVLPAISAASVNSGATSSNSAVFTPPAISIVAAPMLMEIAPAQLSALNAAAIVPIASSSPLPLAPLPTPPPRSFICLCLKPSQYYTRNTPETSFCCAIDYIDEQKVGCCNELGVEVLNLLRPSQRVGYMILCDDHKLRLRAHNCCPGCGIFCTQGKFVLCKQQHFFHPDCAQKFILNSPYDPLQLNPTSPTLVLKCPHCGDDTPEHPSTVTMKCQSLPVFLSSQKAKVNPAKLSIPATSTAASSNSGGGDSTALALEQMVIPESVMNVAESRHFVVEEPADNSPNAEFTTRDLYYAVKNDDLERVAEILATNYDVTTPIPEYGNGTCLHLVADLGTLQMAILLFSSTHTKSLINCQDYQLRTAVICAVMSEKDDILNLLIQHNADLKIRGPEGRTCLHFAARLGNLNAVNMMLSHNTRELCELIDIRDDGGCTAILWAAELGHKKIVKQLVRHRADPNICDNEKNAPLHWVTLHSRNDETLAELLTARAIDLNIQNSDGDTPLHIACRHSKLPHCVRLLFYHPSLKLKNNADQLPYDCLPDKESECARIFRFNMRMRSLRPQANRKTILSEDISNGREVVAIMAKRLNRYNYEMTRAEAEALPEECDDELQLPDFKYISRNIIQHNSILINNCVSQMRTCSCSNHYTNCNTDQCQCINASGERWYEPSGRLKSDFNFEDPPILFECSDTCGCNPRECKNRVVQKGIRERLELYECVDRDKAWGVRALAPVVQGTFIAEYIGEMLTDLEADRRTDDSYFFDLGQGRCIDANFYGNVSRFFNHSCEPNIVAVRVFTEHQDFRFPKICFFACRNISLYEELCFDYGDKFWSVKNRLIACKCLTPSCRYAELNIVADSNQCQLLPPLEPAVQRSHSPNRLPISSVSNLTTDVASSAASSSSVAP